MKNSLTRMLAAAITAVFLLISVPLASSAVDTGSVTIVAFGDSIAAAGSWESYFKTLSGETVINSGVGGETSANALSRISSAVTAKDPDVVFIGFGTNDASIDMARYVDIPTYKANTTRIVEAVRACGAIPIIIAPPPIVDEPYLTRHQSAPFEPYGGPNGLMRRYALATLELCAELDVTAADMYSAFLTQSNWQSLISDGVHPTDAGYRFYAQVALDAYRKATKGDPSLDNKVTATDYLMVKRAVLETYILSAVQNPRADADGNGKVETVDYVMLKRCCLGTYELDRGVPDFSEGNCITPALIPESRTDKDMASNTAELQRCVNIMNEKGGGTVHLPAGTFYFSTQGKNRRGTEDYVCMPKDNVLIIGQGRDTTLCPVGDTPRGLDMFYYNEYADSGFNNPVYLINADFRDFNIDSTLTHAAQYTSAGKGFMFNLFRDCDFDNIICRNTDGTGFGVDCPINCTITNCEAYGCGKAATLPTVGASGFGIGTGYSEDETILIDNCYAEGNKKFGFFFEHQGRFNPTKYTATKLKDCKVTNCVAKNNYNDFGGELSIDITYINCRVPADSTSDSATAFRHHSIRSRLVGCHIEVLFEDVQDESAYYYTPVYWAVDNGITTGSGANKFAISSNCLRAQALVFLYRIAGLPGDLILGNTGEATYYEDALRWAKKAGIYELEDSEVTQGCATDEFVTYMWKFAGSPDAEGSYS
ncbi:MAG: right-handed parallel beta-helix repeat-containing protein, partial [Clostridia bacterium]|nr:right-handed parallel beta-helix repeat-containing protein [Clostridia bacterium]